MKLSVRLLSLILLSSYSVLGQDIILKTSIDRVKVFSLGAQIERSGQINLPTGRNTIQIKSLSPYLDAASVQVSGKGDFTILSVNHLLDYLSEQDKNEKLDSLQQINKDLTKQLDTETARIGVLDSRKNMLEANQKAGGDNTGISFEQLRRLVDYYANEMMEIEQQKIDVKILIEELKTERSKILNQIRQIASGNDLPSSVIMITVDLKKATKASFDLSYFTQNAGWYPQYDVRATDISSPIQLEYKAEVYQNTREDWENVSLVLSNGNPNKSGSAPELVTWYLDFFQTYPRPVSMMKSSGGARMLEAVPEEALTESIPVNLDMESSLPTTNITQNQTTTVFEVREKYSIASNKDRLTVSLQEYEIPASYKYLAVPKLDNEAFLIARITDWEQYSLLPGPASLFLEGTYVGKSFLDSYSANDTLEISLGRDPGIVIERKKVDIFTKSRLIGSNKVETRGFEITVGNPKSSAIDITVLDQIPVSTKNEISINPQQLTGGDLNTSTGEITWELTVPAGQAKELIMSYEVRYPKKQRVILE